MTGVRDSSKSESSDGGKKRSLFSLIGSIPSQLIELIRSEIDQFKAELVRKLKHAGIGIGFIFGAILVAVFAIGVLVAAAILGLAVVLPAWLAALIVGVVLLGLVAVLLVIGVGQFKKGATQPTETISSVRKDIRVIKGTTGRGEK